MVLFLAQEGDLFWMHPTSKLLRPFKNPSQKSPFEKEKEQGHLVKFQPSLLLPVVKVEKALGRVNA